MGVIVILFKRIFFSPWNIVKNSKFFSISIPVPYFDYSKRLNKTKSGVHLDQMAGSGYPVLVNPCTRVRNEIIRAFS